MHETDILQHTQHFVKEALSKAGSPATKIPYFRRIEQLAKTAEEIGREMQLSEKKQQYLKVAAWLYDPENYSEASSKYRELTGTFLSSLGMTAEQTRQITGCLQAATPLAAPKSLLEETFCDALTSYLADTDYLNQMRLLKRELETKLGKPVNEAAWITDLLDYMSRHQFYTSYARQKFGPGKNTNLQILRQTLLETTPFNQENTMDNQPKKSKQKKEKNKKQQTGRGIETMFRTTMTSHLQLSVMADNKANLMISINAIIVSIILSSFIRNFEEMPHLVIPTVLLTAVCLLTIIFALLSTKPTIKMKKSGHVDTSKLDLLFFGDFTEISIDSYRERIKEMMNDPDRLYNGMIENIYVQGNVISKKYRLLKIAYTIFMIGFCMVVLFYMMALLWHARS